MKAKLFVSLTVFLFASPVFAIDGCPEVSDVNRVGFNHYYQIYGKNWGGAQLGNSYNTGYKWSLMFESIPAKNKQEAIKKLTEALKTLKYVSKDRYGLTCYYSSVLGPNSGRMSRSSLSDDM